MSSRSLEVHDLSWDDLGAVFHFLDWVDAKETEAEVGSSKRIVPGIAAEMRVLEGC
jgi:hypothetical protein